MTPRTVITPEWVGQLFDLPTPRIDWSVLDWNESAIRFYESIGAVPMEEWTGYRLTGEALAALGSTERSRRMTGTGPSTSVRPTGPVIPPGVGRTPSSSPGTTHERLRSDP